MGTRGRSARWPDEHRTSVSEGSHRERPHAPLGCAKLPAEVRLRAQALREAAQCLARQSQELEENADVRIREAETALLLARYCRDGSDDAAARWIRATKRIKRSRSAVKVLVVTSLSVDDGVRQEMYRCGADAFLGKRDSATALVPMIRSLHKTSVSPNSLSTSSRRGRGG